MGINNRGFFLNSIVRLRNIAYKSNSLRKMIKFIEKYSIEMIVEHIYYNKQRYDAKQQFWNENFFGSFFWFCKDLAVNYQSKCKRTTNFLQKVKILIICIQFFFFKNVSKYVILTYEVRQLFSWKKNFYVSGFLGR